ncbi:MAG: hypothetical protein ACP5PS_00980 [Bacteroidales bacterium]
MKAKLLLFVSVCGLISCNREELTSFSSANNKYEDTDLKAGTAVNWYLTKADGSVKFAQQSALSWTTATNSYPSITLTRVRNTRQWMALDLRSPRAAQK